MRKNSILAVLAISLVGCASIENHKNNSPSVEFKPVSSTLNNSNSRDRLELGVGYTAYRGANIYGTYKSFTDNSIIDINTQLALSDKSLNGKQLFAVPEIDSHLSLGYAASFRDFKIIPTDSTTKNMNIALNAISSFAFSNRETLVTTMGAERITSKTELLFPLSTTYRLDNRVHPQLPTEGFGYFLKSTAEIAPFGISYLKGSVRGQLDIPIKNYFLENLALSFKGFIGASSSLGNNSLPITKRLFLENGSPVRGYAANAFGYNANNVPIGGNLMATGSVELWMPLFHEDLRAYTFFDAGIMRGNGINSAQSNLKTSVGAGVAWVSPIGVITVSYGQALDKNTSYKQAIGISLGFNY